MRRAAAIPGTARGDALWAIADQGVGLATSTLSFLLLGRGLGASGYGAFVGLYALLGPCLALSQSGVYLAAMEHVVRNGEDPREVGSSCLGITTAAGLLWVPVLSWASLRFIPGLPVAGAVLLVAAEALLNGALAATQGIVQALTGFSGAVRVRLLAASARVAMLLLLVAEDSLTQTTFAVGQLVTLGAVLFWTGRRVSTRLGGPLRPGRVRLRHLRSAALYGAGIAASNAQAEGDKFVLNAAHHQADAGRYGAASRILAFAYVPVTALVGVTHLSFLESSVGPGAQVRRAARLSLLAAAYTVPAVLLLELVAPLIPRILTRSFEESALILRLLAPVLVLRAVGGFPFNGLMGLGRNALRTKILAANAVLALVLYAALVPAHGWRGALVATFVADGSLCLLGWSALLACDRPRTAAPAAGPVVAVAAPVTTTRSGGR